MSNFFVCENVENNSISKEFATAIVNFRMKFPQLDLSDLINNFQEILLKDSKRNDENIGLEWLFWCILNSLLDTEKFKTTEIDNVINIGKITITDPNLIEKYKILNVLNQFNSFKMTNDEDIIKIISKLPNIKWENTKLDLIIGESNLNSIDSDSIFRNSNSNSNLNLNLNEIDSNNDEIFFQMAFNLILSNNFKELKEICDLSSNFEFWGIVQNYYSISLNLDSFPIWRKTMFKLTNVTKNKWEKSCYGLLCGDYNSSSICANSFEQKLYCYLNNMFQNGLEDLLPKFELNLTTTTLISPPLIFNKINDALDSISQDSSNSKIFNQCKNPIRVLIGSLISNNSKLIMESTLNLILKNDSTTTNEENSYLLRILTNFSIILHLKFGDLILKTDDYIKILKIYCLRLLLNKLYYQIPIYISFIPNDELINTYSNILSNFSSINIIDKLSIDEFKREQIKSMRNLQLPMEEIIRLTMLKIFKNTEFEYNKLNFNDINLNYNCNEIDKLLIDQLNWSIIGNMSLDSILCSQTILRRFLITGKIGSCLKFLELINLPNLIQNYSLLNLSNNDKPLLEIIQFHQLIILIEKITNLNNIEIKLDLLNVLKLSNELIILTENWLLNLIKLSENDNDNDDKLIFIELRKLYLPTIINTNIDLLIKYKPLSDKLIKFQLSKLFISIGNENYKIWEIYDTENLKLLLNTIGDLSCELWDENSDGIFI